MSTPEMAGRPEPGLLCVDLCAAPEAHAAIEQALVAALRLPGGPEASDAQRRAFVRRTMGWSTVDVLTRWFGEDTAVPCANLVFEMVFEELVGAGWCAVSPDVAEMVEAVRAAGVPTVILTGLAAAVRDRVLATVGWQVPADLLLSPDDVGRGRPWPDLVHGAMRATATHQAASVVVVGSTAADMVAGRRAGAGTRIGIRSPAEPTAHLWSAGATMVCASLSHVPGALGLETLRSGRGAAVR